MEVRILKVIDASDLAAAINEKHHLRWRPWHVAYYLFHDKTDYSIRYYYFSNDEEEDYDINDLLVSELLREQFPNEKSIYIDLGR